MQTNFAIKEGDSIGKPLSRRQLKAIAPGLYNKHRHRFSKRVSGERETLWGKVLRDKKNRLDAMRERRQAHARPFVPDKAKASKWDTFVGKVRNFFSRKAG